MPSCFITNLQRQIFLLLMLALSRILWSPVCFHNSSRISRHTLYVMQNYDLRLNIPNIMPTTERKKAIFFYMHRKTLLKE